MNVFKEQGFSPYLSLVCQYLCGTFNAMRFWILRLKHFDSIVGILKRHKQMLVLQYIQIQVRYIKWDDGHLGLNPCSAMETHGTSVGVGRWD